MINGAHAEAKAAGIQVDAEGRSLANSDCKNNKQYRAPADCVSRNPDIIPKDSP